MPVRIGFRTSPQNVDWPTLDAAWAEAGQHDVFDSGWLNDHLSDPARERGGPSFEAITVLAALAHRVPGKWVGHTVLSVTFRHPGVVAKQALTLDHVTGGRFVLGFGAGWHQGEHEMFGVELPPIRERLDRLEATLRVMRALFRGEAEGGDGGADGVVSVDAASFRLREARLEPPPVREGGPPIWLGGQKPRGMALAARYADGWNYPANAGGTPDEFLRRRDRLVEACAAVGRDPGEMVVSVQLPVRDGRDGRAEGLRTATAYARAGAAEIMLSIPARSGAEGIRALAREVAEPLRESEG
jgi:alkanesulfonate monooxygenase SsuD/methylene tetrahydromethanopterin reductase-like flavin-dependent oxidoreductase (luciferase family)